MQSLQEKDKQYIWHPFTSLVSAPDPIPIVQGEGVYLIDENGKRYIDAISSWWVTIHGHGHSYIAEKIYKQALQLEQVIFAGFTHRPAVELAERLLPLLPGPFTRIFYSDNGSTSTEVAIKMALQFWWNHSHPAKPLQKTKILALRGGYHGDTFGAMSMSDRSVFTLAFQEKLFEVVFIDPPEAGNIDGVEQTVNRMGDELAAFIYEPLLQGAGSMRMYDAGYMNRLLGACKRNDVICIADEVMTGFGRTGRMFASEYMQQQPDIICLSKGLTGGTMALGVTACTQKIVDAFLSEEKVKTFFHGHSFTANPLACSAALASLDLFERESCNKAITSIVSENTRFANQLQAYRTVKNPRCLGTVIAFEYVSGEDGYFNTISRHITAYMLEKGVFIRPLGNTVYIMPPYCITGEQLHDVYEAITAFLEDKTM